MCQHRSRIGNSEGETCLECGKVLAGYGAYRPYPSECRHEWTCGDRRTSPSLICCYCYTERPNPEYIGNEIQHNS